MGPNLVASALLVAATSLTDVANSSAVPAVPGVQASVDAGTVKGVNPADILNRADFILKVINLPAGETVVGVLKFDKKLGRGLGANMELPFASYVDGGPVQDFGIGDLFARVRFVRALSPRMIGLIAVEGVAPIADGPLLGTGKWQINPAVGIVRLWSPRSFTAAIYKHSFSFAGKADRPEISVNEARLLHTLLLDRGFYLTFDVKHDWQTLGPNQNWSATEFEIGRQFNARWAASVRVGKTHGDRPNDGTIELNVRTFF